MRVHYLLNHGAAPESKLADVEIHFEEGILSGLKLVGCSVWRSKKGEDPTVLVPSRSYATAGGVRYYDLLRPSEEGKAGDSEGGKLAARKFRQYIREEYQKIAMFPQEGEPIKGKRSAGK
ncbi:MAG TPA: hypothetical protein VFU42_03495 [Candidatus Deferrimicrobiaceae bacterium]|nr:hypothetical protein [Candidatus Deferrimicrobiaceae bacterium]